MRERATAGTWAGRAYATAIMLYLVAPLVMVVVLSFNAGDYVAFPPDGLSLRWYRQIAASRELVAAFLLSLRLAAFATALALALGVPLAIAVVRLRVPGGAALRALALGPLLLPEVLLGLALLQFTAGVVRQNPSMPLLVGAHAVIVLPFVVQLTAGALATLSAETEDAAATLGARPWRVLMHVTLPSIAGALGSAALLGFIFSFDNVAISLFLSAPGIETLPVRLYEQATYTSDPSIAAVSAVLVAIGLAAILLLSRLRGLERGVGLGG